MEAIIRENKGKDVKKSINVLCTEELLSKVGGGVFGLVRIAMARALELASGKPPLIDNASSDKVTTIALEEIAQGKIILMKKALHREKEEEVQPEIMAIK